MIYHKKEANFGRVVKKEVRGGTHITLEIIVKIGKKYLAFRRVHGIEGHPQSQEEKSGRNIYFCHDLIRRGETIFEATSRIVKKQAGIRIIDCKVVFIDSIIKNNQWAIIPYIMARTKEMPKSNNGMEVILFDKKSVPTGFAWWTEEEVKEFIKKNDNY